MKKIVLLMLFIFSTITFAAETFKVGSVNWGFDSRSIYTTCIEKKVYFIIDEVHRSGLAPKLVNSKTVDCSYNNLNQSIKTTQPILIDTIHWSLDSRKVYKFKIDSQLYYIIDTTKRTALTPVL